MFLSILFAFILLTTDAFPEGSSIFCQASQFNFTNHGTMTAKEDAIQHKYEAGSVQHVTKNGCNIFYHINQNNNRFRGFKVSHGVYISETREEGP